MLNPLLKSVPSLVLLFALAFPFGIVPVAGSSAGTALTDLCCGQDAETPQPATEGECSDPGCRCPFCSVSLLSLHSLSLSSPQEPSARPWLLAAGPLADYRRAIDYPPELL